MKLIKLLLIIDIAIFAVLIVISLFYFIGGSLESFPTPEQKAKVKLVSGIAVLVFVALEILLWRAYRRIQISSKLAAGVQK